MPSQLQLGTLFILSEETIEQTRDKYQDNKNGAISHNSVPRKGGQSLDCVSAWYILSADSSGCEGAPQSSLLGVESYVDGRLGAAKSIVIAFWSTGKRLPMTLFLAWHVPIFVIH